MCMLLVLCGFFFFKQKTAYEMRISDWSSDVCSSDLRHPSPTLPCLRRRGSQKLAAEAAPAGVRGPSQGEFEIVDQAGAAQPRGDEGDAPTLAVFRLVQVTIPHDRIVDREARRLDRKSTPLNSSPQCAAPLQSSA